MNRYAYLNSRLGTLTVFRNILGEPVIARLRELLSCEDWDKLRLAELYCGFVHELYLTGDSLTDWVLRYISGDENPYVGRIISGGVPGKLMEESLTNELKILEELAALDCGEVAEAINCGLELQGLRYICQISYVHPGRRRKSRARPPSRPTDS